MHSVGGRLARIRTSVARRRGTECPARRGRSNSSVSSDRSKYDPFSASEVRLRGTGQSLWRDCRYACSPPRYTRVGRHVPVIRPKFQQETCYNTCDGCVTHLYRSFSAFLGWKTAFFHPDPRQTLQQFPENRGKGPQRQARAGEGTRGSRLPIHVKLKPPLKPWLRQGRGYSRGKYPQGKRWIAATRRFIPTTDPYRHPLCWGFARSINGKANRR